VKPDIGITCRLTEASESPSFSTPVPYVKAVEAQGGAALLIPTVNDPASLLRVLQVLDGLVITGGADVDPACYGQAPQPELGEVSPTNDAVDRLLVEQLLAWPELPMLAICRGIQAVNVFAGGTLYQDIAAEVPNALQHGQKAPRWHGSHAIRIETDSLLATLVGSLDCRVNSFHHQAVREVAEGWRVTARTSDGVVEALEQTGGTFRLAVQFHPEWMAGDDECMAAIFNGLVHAGNSRSTQNLHY